MAMRAVLCAALAAFVSAAAFASGVTVKARKIAGTGPIATPLTSRSALKLTLAPSAALRLASPAALPETPPSLQPAPRSSPASRWMSLQELQAQLAQTKGKLADPSRTDDPSQIPGGVVRAETSEAQTFAELKTLLPRHENGLTGAIKPVFERLAPLKIITYHDSLGGKFFAIDLKGDPTFVNIFPEQAAHEKALVRKLLAHTKDVQLLVPEEGLTPDLIVSGRALELKTCFGYRPDLAGVLQAKNQQVRLHAIAHGLGRGAVAIDLTKANRVPVDEVTDALARFHRDVGNVALEWVLFFAGNEAKAFKLGERGYEPRRVDEAFATAEKAERQARLMRASTPSELDLFVRKITRLVHQKRWMETYRLWDQFAQHNSSEKTAVAQRKLVGVLPRIRLSQRRAAAPPDQGRMLEDLNGPAKALESAGVSRTVMFAGGTRIPEPAAAQEQLRETVARYGDAPATAQGHAALERAKNAVVLSANWKLAHDTAYLIGKVFGAELGISQGGGAGIMKAARVGARAGGAPTIDYQLEIWRDADGDRPGHVFHRLSTRKEGFRFNTLGYFFFAGGPGTKDEFWDALAHNQTLPAGSRPPIIVLESKDEWRHVRGELADMLKHGLVSKEDAASVFFARTADQAVDEFRRSLQSPGR